MKAYFIGGSRDLSCMAAGKHTGAVFQNAKLEPLDIAALNKYLGSDHTPKVMPATVETYQRIRISDDIWIYVLKELL